MLRTSPSLLSRFLDAVARRLLLGSSLRRSPSLIVGIVDDPRRPIRLIRAAGVIDPVSVTRVIGTWEHLTAPHLVHLDLEDAAIVDETAMNRLEAGLDDLESMGIDVRIVGVDPHHPAIAS